MRNACTILAVKRRRIEDSIKMDLVEVLDWLLLAQDKVQWADFCEGHM
jgi:hypothetical protein